MKVIFVAGIEENTPLQKTGIGRYASSLLAIFKSSKQFQFSLYTTKKRNRILNTVQKIIGKDINNVLTTMPLYYPFKKFPKESIIHLAAQTLAVPLALQKPRQPTIVTVHDIIPYACNEYHSVWEKLLYHFAMKGLKNATHIMTDSEHTKKDIIKLLGIPQERITVVYLGIDVDEFQDAGKNKKKIERQQNTILYVGSETRRKNLSILLKAVAEVKKQIPDVKLIKVGLPEDKKEHTKLQKLANKLQISENILWKGYVDNLAKEYRKATVFVLPSLYEGFGFPVLEAMTCGCPVICSSKTSLPELARDAGLYFDGYDYHQLAAQICLVLTNKGLQKKLRERGVKNVKSFTWQKCIKATEEVYSKYAKKNKKV